MRYFSMFTGIGGFEKGIEQAYESISGGLGTESTDQKPKQAEPEVQFGRVGATLEEGHGLLPTDDRGERPVCIGYSEIDKYACQIYSKHYPTHKNYGDCTTIDPTTLPDFDLLVGGFPCQAFSIAGKRRGFEDTRGTLFFDVAKILREKRPRNFVLENVKGLLSHDNGNTFKTIISTLAELGYGVEWQVLNSKNFGVPQNRERVYIVGHLGGFGGRQVFPIQLIHRQADGLQQATEGQQPRILGDSTSEGRDFSRPENWRDAQGRPRVRRLTPTECERLQGFPDGWTEGVSDTQRYKCLGNAVTVNTVQAVMERLYKKQTT